MDLKEEALESHIEYLRECFRGKAFASGRSGWYRNGDGVNWTLWPKSFVSYWWRAYSCDERDYLFG